MGSGRSREPRNLGRFVVLALVASRWFNWHGTGDGLFAPWPAPLVETRYSARRGIEPGCRPWRWHLSESHTSHTGGGGPIKRHAIALLGLALILVARAGPVLAESGGRSQESPAPAVGKTAISAVARDCLAVPCEVPGAGLSRLKRPHRFPWCASPLPQDDLELAERYAPVLYFHPEELFRPQPVEVMVGQARLRRARTGWFDVNVLSRLSVRDLFLYHGAEYFLDAWYGDAGASDYMNYSAHRAHYEASLSPAVGGLPVTAYARVVREQEAITLQYWLFYYYNDWFNKHEGDWEMAQVILNGQGQPRWLVVSQHHGGTRRAWSAVAVADETHPAVFVALGSHANYFWGGEVYPTVRDVGGEPFVAVDRTGRADPVIPRVLLLPELEDVAASQDAWPGMEWLRFGGNWGERSLQSDFGGPQGPAQKAEQWDQPYEWGMDQPSDEEEWYAHRLRLAVRADRPVEAELGPTTDLPLEEMDCIERDGGKRVVCLLHRDPDLQEAFEFSVTAPQGARVAVTTVYPLPARSQTTRVTYDEIALAPGESLVGRLCASCGPGLALADPGGQAGTLDVTYQVESRAAVWDAPDIIWMAGLLPAADIARGIGLALLAGLGPTLIYVLGLYWVDRYEQEPKGLLAAAFFWGAIPAVLTAVVVRLVFRLPPSLLGPEAVEAVGAGVVAPLLEELLKVGAVLFIYLRHRKEFDGVVDGIVYGAMVGFGFAMMGNTISYLGAFLLHGWSGLGARVFTQGLVYGLNHALYTAVFGAGLGFARTMRAGRPRWAPALGGFLLAVLAHALHNVVLRQALGWSVITIVATWAGVLAIAGLLSWALVRERRVLVTELAGEIPDELYVQMVAVGGRPKMWWQALMREGWRGRQRVRRQVKLCAELAFKKSHARRHPDEPLMAEIEELREEVHASVRHPGGG